MENCFKKGASSKNYADINACAGDLQKISQHICTYFDKHQ